MPLVKKRTIKAHSAPWIDDELSKAFKERNNAKVVATKSKLDSDILKCRKLCKDALKLNRKKKVSFYENAFKECKTDSKTTWNTIRGLLGTSNKDSPSTLDVNGHVLTKPMMWRIILLTILPAKWILCVNKLYIIWKTMTY